MKRFWDKVEKTEVCWNWKAGGRGKGYGAIKYKGKKYDAHRFVWFLTYKKWPKQWILHKCDNPKCVRPDHLFEGTPRDNWVDAVRKNRIDPYKLKTIGISQRKSIISEKAWCNKCKRQLPISGFHKKKDRYNGLQTRCVECRKKLRAHSSKEERFPFKEMAGVSKSPGLTYMINKDIKLFLKESNAIENVWDDSSLTQAKEAWDFIVKENKLTTENILTTHRILMHNKLSVNERGHFRKVQVFVGGEEKMPWYAVPTLMKQWIINANDVVANGQHENEEFLEKVTRKHHVTFEDIHPFVDGNGRIGRILMNWQRIKIGKPILVILEKSKQEYYDWF